jgi:hypothetical protein
MNLNTKGIRIHGTNTVASLGYNASHGCIRMRMSDVEELFDRVDVGTPVMIIQSGAMRVFQASGPPTLEQLVESDGAGASVQPPAAPAPAASVPSAPAPPNSTAPDPLPAADEAEAEEDEGDQPEPPLLDLDMRFPEDDD